MHHYSLSIAWSEEDKAFIATCLEFPELLVHGETRDEALSAGEAALELLIEDYEDAGDELPKPRVLSSYSGQVRLRMPKRLHGDLAREADEQETSLNTLIVTYLSSCLCGEQVSREVVHTVKSRTDLLSEQLASLLDKISDIDLASTAAIHQYIRLRSSSYLHAEGSEVSHHGSGGISRIGMRREANLWEHSEHEQGYLEKA